MTIKELATEIYYGQSKEIDLSVDDWIEKLNDLFVSPKKMKEDIKKLIKECEEIAGRWNGDESGYLEDQAHIAGEIIEKANELIVLINELNGTDEPI